MAKKLYIASQDESTRKWHTIAMLTKLNVGYQFVFTKGVRHLRSIPNDLFGMSITDKYDFQNLIPILKNRLPSRTRPDFSKLANWLNLEGNEDEFTMLSRFGLIPGTDALLLYPEPQMDRGLYNIEFFVHGIRHMHPAAKDCCETILEGDRLLPVLDVQNPMDPNAVAIRSNDSVLIGYVPAFYAWDFSKILREPRWNRDARITVVRNNTGAPDQLRLLCKFTAEVGPNFEISKDETQQPIREDLVA